MEYSLDNDTLLFPGPLSVPDEPFSFTELDAPLLNECPPDWMDHFYNYNAGDDEAPIFFLPETVHQPAPEPTQHRRRPRQPQYRPSELGPASGRRGAGTRQTSLDASLRQEPDCNDPFFLDRDFYAAEIAALLLRRNDTKRTTRRRREKRPSPLSREVAKR